MTVLIILLTAWLVFRGIGSLGVAAFATWQASACYGLAVMFVFTGIAHFNKMKHDLVRMVPATFGQPMLLVYVTGTLEFMGAAGLLLPRFRSLAGICLIVLLIALFPANVHAVFQRSHAGGQAGHCALVASPYAAAIDWASVVVQPSVRGSGG